MVRAAPIEIETSGNLAGEDVFPGRALPPAPGLDESGCDAAPKSVVTRHPESAPPERRLRRHRRGAGLPALLPRADFPEDAEGRVAVIAINPGPDVLPGVLVAELAVEEITDAAHPLGPVGNAIGVLTGTPVRLFMRGGVAGWVPVVALAALFVIIFVIGMRLAK